MIPVSMRSDAHLLQKAGAGDDRAFAALMRRYGAAAHAAAFARLGNRADAARVAASAFAGLRGAPMPEDDVCLPRRLATTVADLCRNPTALPPVSDEILREDPEQGRADAALRQKLLALDPDTRETALICFGGGLSVSQAAQWRGRSPAEIRQTLDRAGEALSTEERSRVPESLAVDRLSQPFARVLGREIIVTAPRRRGTTAPWAAGAAALALTALAAGLILWTGAERPDPAPPRLEAGVEVAAPQPVTPAAAPASAPARSEGAVEGRVVDAHTGRPLPTFEVAHPEDVKRGPDPPFLRVADPGGRFYLGDVRPGDATLVVRAPGYAESSKHVRVEPFEKAGATAATVRLRKLPVFEGVVADEAGQPISDAFVFAGPVPPDYRRDEAVLARTGDDGRFRVTGLSGPSQTLTVWHPDYVPRTREAAPIEPDGREESWTLEPGGKIGGRFGTADSGLAARMVLTEPDFGEFRAEALVGPDGAFLLAGIPPGQYRLRGEDGTGRAVVRTVSVEAGETRTVDFDCVEPSAFLEGEVAADGDAPQVGSVEIRIETPSGYEQWGPYPLQGGRFHIGPLPPGRATVDVFAISRSSRTRRGAVDVDLEPEQTRRLEMALDGRFEVRGVLKGLAPGRYARIYAFPVGSDERPADREALERLGRRAAGRRFAREDGPFQISGLEPGRYTVLAVSLEAETEEAFSRASLASVAVELPQAADESVELRFE